MDETYPIVVMQDRYRGVYSGGAWLAVASATNLVDGPLTRAEFCQSRDNGPSDCEVGAGIFWQERPDWIAVGPTPNEATEALLTNMTSDELRHNERVLRTYRTDPR